MKGILINFRGGKHTKSDNQMVLQIDGVKERQQATPHIGKKVTWTTPTGKKIEGQIRTLHGNKGCVRVHFAKGMPGQSVGTPAEVS